ncbi:MULTISPECIES: helix-turn-helix transcriptional regulator [unclassified Streptomyces]|uniref:helix-turn-helix domain-containing protein n=1 Tax=unclassified Streptomyces TaxID=2593676 RepID=UPI0034165646
MARWRPLPADLPPEHRRLVLRLRVLKDRAGASLTALAHRTSRSPSSWQRYLNGLAFPPWDAAEALAGLTGVDDADRVRLRVLWEAAEAVRASPPAAERETPERETPEPEPGVPEAVAPPAGGPQPHRTRGGLGGIPLRLWAGVLVALLLAAALASVAPEGRRAGGAWPVDVRAEAASSCRGDSCAGLDARRTGCVEDRRTLGRYEWGEHRVELLHSPACATVWGEAAPPAGVRGIALSVPGAGQRWEREGSGRSRMLPAPDRLGSGVQFCAVFDDVQTCVDAGNRVHSGPLG